MTKPARAPAMPEVPAKPATANINLALAHLLTLGAVVLAPAQALINTLVLARVTPAAPAPPVVASIQLAIARHLILGHLEPALALQLTNTPALVVTKPAAQEQYVAANTLHVLVQVAMNGTAAVAKNKFLMGLKVIYTIVTMKLSELRLMV